MTAPEHLTERQRLYITQARETVTLTAAAIAAGMRDVDMNSKESVYWAAYSRTKTRLADVLGVVADLTVADGADARMVGEIRGVLTMFDWEHDDRQLALKAIERIVGGER